MNFFHLLFPPRCYGCGCLGRYICSSCQKQLPVCRDQRCLVCEKPAVDGVTHARCKGIYTLDGMTECFWYHKSIKEWIKSIKYQFVRDAGEMLIANICDEQLYSVRQFLHLHPNSVVLPIPLHWKRQWWRGFNQAEVIGKVLAKRLSISMDTKILERKKHTTPQAEVVKRKDRLKHIADAFIVRSLTPESVILVDDVCTTGATMREAAKTLRKAGAKHVWGFAIAR